MEVSFLIDRWTNNQISQVMERAERLGLIVNTRTHHTMDLTAVHANGCPLDFQRMLDADDFNFMHDFAGIYRHLDRDSGKLRNGFWPRFAAKQYATDLI